MKTAEALLYLSAIGIGIYVASKLAESGSSTPEPAPTTSPGYDPYSTGSNSIFQGMVTPLSKERLSPRLLTTSANERAKIEGFEGRRYTAYRDPAGVLTIGVGHEIKAGDGLNAQSVLTDAQIDTLFDNDIFDAENSIYTRVIVPLSQGEFDALIDFIFEFGDTKFGGSTLLRLLNQEQYESVPAEFAKWVNVNGVPNAQVEARRTDDQNTFLV